MVIKRIQPFGETAVSGAVKRFFEAHDIDPTDVRSYSIKQNSNDLEVITIEMYFEDIPEKEGS